MINYGKIARAATPVLKQAGKFIKANPHYLIEGLLGSGLLASIGYNVKSEKEHEKRDELVKNQLKRNQTIIKDLSSKAEKVDKLEKCNELLIDALTKECTSTVGA